MMNPLPPVEVITVTVNLQNLTLKERTAHQHHMVPLSQVQDNLNKLRDQILKDKELVQSVLTMIDSNIFTKKLSRNYVFHNMVSKIK
jgi:hypothetical protein